MKLINILFVIIIGLFLAITSTTNAQPTNQSLYISCGLPRSTTTTSSDNRVWRSDDDPTFSPPGINSVSSTVTTTNSLAPPYNSVRLFRSPLTYTFSLTPGPKFLRLYFTTTTSYNNILPSQFFLSLQANDLIIFENFSPFLNSPNNTQSMYEFHLTVENHLNLTFSPGNGGNNNNSNSSSNSNIDNNGYGFINALEIVSIPEGLYVNLTKIFKYVTNLGVGYNLMNTSALQTVYRLNVGGSDVSPVNDSGSMWRTWLYDSTFLAPGSFPGTPGGLLVGSTPELNYTMIPPYVAPGLVYATVRIMGLFTPEFNLRNNLTWKFEVDPGFDYLVRLHFCEMDLNITGSGQRKFDVLIDNQTAEIGVDVWQFSGGRGVPIYRDYVIRVDSGGGGGDQGPIIDARNGTKVPFWLALHPEQGTLMTDVLLNGLEIFKISEVSGESNYLAAPNPPLVSSPTTPLNPTIGSNNNSKKNSVPIIGGVIGGVILASLLIFGGILVYKRRAQKVQVLENKTINTLSKDKLDPLSFMSGSSANTVISSSLPSDLCRRFLLVEIKVATSDFDEDLVIGVGGFGKVYKGSIDGGTTLVAIKRLNPTSKQGAREFLTEIEMLSRLRHVHLVSLIGYCEDEGEMILVYEYMSRGTLRDLLMYKNIKKDDQDITTLSWKERVMICLGSARGIHYLHTGGKEVIIHRDIKSTNILIDDKWTAKVSDFGLSKVGPLFGEVGNTHVSTVVKGSVGYLDPEYYRRQQLTEKSDVYSFGVVLFEVLCGRPVVNPNLPREQANLAVWARRQYKNGMLHTIVDPNLVGQIAPECLRKFGEIAEKCVNDHGSDRPSMGDVVWGLEFVLQLQETAEKNNIDSGGTIGVFSYPTGFSTEDGSTTENEAFTTSGDNLSQNSISTKKLLDSNSNMSSSSNYPFAMKSGSVFSEINEPQAR